MSTTTRAGRGRASDDRMPRAPAPRDPATREPHDLRGRTALITGGSAGIGRAVATALAARGATVLVVSRAGGAGAAFVDELVRRTGDASHRFLPADLSSLAEVRALAAEVRATTPRLDVLLNNAGGVFPWRRESVDGIEMTFALDHLAGMLLTLLLLDPLTAAHGRVVTTSSLMAHWGWLRRDVQGRRLYNGTLAYAQARLANVLFTVELARRVPAEALTVHAFDPGVVRTGLGAGPGLQKFFLRLSQAWVGREVEVGAETGVFLAADPSVEGTTGGFWKDGRRGPLPRGARDPSVAARLWEVSLALLAPGEDELAPLRRAEALR